MAGPTALAKAALVAEDIFFPAILEKSFSPDDETAAESKPDQMASAIFDGSAFDEMDLVSACSNLRFSLSWRDWPFRGIPLV